MTIPTIAQEAFSAKEMRTAEKQAAQIAVPSLLSGEPIWAALKKGIKDMTRLAPKDHDVFVRVDDVRVLKALFIHPQAFFFEGLDGDGNHTRIIVHFSQLKARIVYCPKRGLSRAVTEMKIRRGAMV